MLRLQWEGASLCGNPIVCCIDSNTCSSLRSSSNTLKNRPSSYTKRQQVVSDDFILRNDNPSIYRKPPLRSKTSCCMRVPHRLEIGVMCVAYPIPSNGCHIDDQHISKEAEICGPVIKI
ncbi:hypothetical protein NPIL_601541 [Nephila pilipes]|uniref:Uncharacterized protein n=1 Tax=Nephila pilipes TaxID=299642 RepID=A0A8X6MT94_NEPPI|nr:hypothetical protein NPIL_601541 [Nephila pilipes]